MILCDTNVIIEILKGDDKIIKIIERIGLENIAISSVTVIYIIILSVFCGEIALAQCVSIQLHRPRLSA